MTGENTFVFEATTSNGPRRGTGLFEDSQVNLNYADGHTLSVPRDPAVTDAVTLADLAGDYSGPDAMYSVTVTETGAYTMKGLGGTGTGTLTIPEAEINLLVDEMDFITYDNETGSNRGLGVYHEATGYLFFINNREDEVWTIVWLRG